MHESPYSKVAKKMYMKETNPTQIHEEKKKGGITRTSVLPQRQSISTALTHVICFHVALPTCSIIQRGRYSHQSYIIPLQCRQFLETRPVEKKSKMVDEAEEEETSIVAGVDDIFERNIVFSECFRVVIEKPQ